MKTTFRKELPSLVFVILPFLYLAFIWNTLPEKVPIHWNMNGEIDGWGEKLQLLLIPFVLPVLVYIIFLIVPKIDPKNKIEKIGNKYHQLKFAMVLFMSALAVLIIYSSSNQSSKSITKYIFVLIGFLFVVLGNYFKTIKPNYFIGIKTPWTLENETVWKETHSLAGKLWFVGGLVMVAVSFVLKGKIHIVVYSSIVAIISIIPIVFSYIRFKALKK